VAEWNRMKSCLDYTFKVLLGEEAVHLSERKYIVYSEPVEQTGTPVRLCIVPSGFFSERIYGTPESLPSLPLKSIEGVPLLFGNPTIERKGEQLIIYADIFASTYFLVTRYEEMVRRDVRDEHGRFPGKQSLPYRAGFIDWPIVDEYANLLRKWLRIVNVTVPDNNRKFSVLLTHDVDTFRKYRNPLRTAASAALGHRPWRDVPENIAVWLGLKRDPFDTFDEMLQLDASLLARGNNVGTHVVYFFMAGGKRQFDGMYDIHSRRARKLIRKIRDSGAIIGLHSSYDAGLHPELIDQEKTTLGNICGLPVHYNRHHYLSWREIEDGRALSKAGITHDSSLGYADVAGFRLGVCRPIPLFDPVNMEPLRIQEHPLIVMDCTLSNSNYMNLREEEAFNYCVRLISQTYKHNGEFVMLWHNTMFVPGPGNYHIRLYRRLLNETANVSFQ
jgi:hypothetical protein